MLGLQNASLRIFETKFQVFSLAFTLLLLKQNLYTVESLDFTVAQFSWNLWVPFIYELTSSTNV